MASRAGPGPRPPVETSLPDDRDRAVHPVLDDPHADLLVEAERAGARVGVQAGRACSRARARRRTRRRASPGRCPGRAGPCGWRAGRRTPRCRTGGRSSRRRPRRREPATSRRFQGSKPGRSMVRATKSSNGSRSRTDHSRNASSSTVQHASWSVGRRLAERVAVGQVAVRDRRALGQLQLPAVPAHVVAERRRAAGRRATRPAPACPRPRHRRRGRGACIQRASAVPMPRPRWSGCTAASPRSPPMCSPYATSRSPSKTPTVPAATSYDGRCQSPTMSASSIAISAEVVLLLGGHHLEDGAGVVDHEGPVGQAGGQVEVVGHGADGRHRRAAAPELRGPGSATARLREGPAVACRGEAGSGVADRRDVELELDLVGDQHAAGLERGVPGHAPVLAVDGGAALEADADGCRTGPGRSR